MNWGVGLSVTLRMRMGAHDAHYAGDLVDGARMLALFGDVATELLVRLDGDEGLFRAYDVVEFLAPVFAGDFVEATGVIAAVGNTSRRIVFEARKVAGNVRASGLAPSAADMYEQPVVVCRAEGTCVVPLALQRKSHAAGKALPAPDFWDASLALGQGRVVVPPAPHYVITPVRKTPPEVILTAAIVGAEVTRDKTPHLPITAAEIADEAARCRDAGAAIVHLHVRDAQGKPSQSAALFREAILAIQAKTDVIIQTSTGGAVGMSIEERAQPLDLYPEMATLNCGSVNFGNEVFVNTRAEIRDLLRRIRAAGATPELECYEVGHIHEALHLKEEGLLTDPLHFQFVLGIPGAIKAKEEVVAFMASQLPPAASWGVAAVGPYQEPMTEAAMRLGGHARVGLEDNIYLSKGVLAEGSAPLVARAAAFARSIGRSPVEPMRARALLGMVTRERR